MNLQKVCLFGIAILISISMFWSCNSTPTVQTSDGPLTMDADSLLKIIGDAYVYGYPLVLMDLSKQAITNIEAPHPTRATAPINQLGHYRNFPDHTMKRVVKPNVDTYYSVSWLDLSAEPMVLSMPATDRYYMMPFYDAYTNVISSPGTRTTGTDAIDIIVTGPNWKGDIPEDMYHVDAPTQMVWLIGRIQVNSPEDGATTVRAIQDQMRLVPLSAIDQDNYTPPPGKVNPELADMIPSKAIRKLDAKTFFNRLSSLMADNPPQAADAEILKKMSSIGLTAGEPFELTTDNLILKTKLGALPEFIHKRMEERRDNPQMAQTKNGWIFITDSIGRYGTDYSKRAYLGFVGLGVNLPEDAVYPICTFDKDGNSLDARNNYTIHFDKDELPPAKAFWSLTAYNEDEFLVKNDLNRFALGDRDALQYNPDGSLDLYIQHLPPDPSKMSNWLPIPKENRFSVALRLYWPEEAVFDGSWSPPYMVKTS